MAVDSGKGLPSLLSQESLKASEEPAAARRSVRALKSVPPRESSPTVGDAQATGQSGVAAKGPVPSAYGDAVLRVLVVEDSAEMAEGYATALRGLGYQVHFRHISTAIEFRRSLAAIPFDIVLCASGIEQVDAWQALSIHGEAESDTPFIVLAPQEQCGTLRGLMDLGARDVVAKTDLDHLCLAVNRELGDLAIRRRLQEMRAKLQSKDDQYRAVLENSPVPMALIGYGLHVYANAAYRRLFGYQEKEDMGKVAIQEMVAPSDHGKLAELLRSSDLRHQGKGTMALVGRQRDGSNFDVNLDLARVYFQDKSVAQVTVWQSASCSVPDSDPQQGYKRVHDTVTGLYARTHFVQLLDTAFAESGSTPSGILLLYVALDRFGDTPRPVADAALVEAATILKEVLEPADIAGRIEENGFAVLVSQPNILQGQRLAEAIRNRMRQRFPPNGVWPSGITCSVGVAFASPQRTKAAELLGQCRSSCHAAQANGGNAVQLYQPGKTKPAVKRASPPPSTATAPTPPKKAGASPPPLALDRSRLRLAYQPIVCLEDHESENFSVLLRMTEGGGKMLKASDFLPDAIAHGQCMEFDRWVIETAISTLARLRSGGRQVNFFIKLSEDAIRDDSLVPWICDCLRLFRAKPFWFTFQVDEAHVLAHYEKAAKVFEMLSPLKCRMALDEFGTGETSRNLLGKLPVDFVRFHGGVTRDVNVDPVQNESLAETVKMARSHDVKTIAKLVERAGSVATLWKAGVNYIQGNFILEPAAHPEYDFRSTI